jgi:hypothetical protein
MSIFAWIKNLFTSTAPSKIEEDDSHLAPYKIEPQDAVHSTVVDTTVTWPFSPLPGSTPVEGAGDVGSHKKAASPKTAAAMTPAKPKAMVPAKPKAKPAAAKTAKPKTKPVTKKAPKSK